MGEEWGTADQPGECAQLLAIQVVLLDIFFCLPCLLLHSRIYQMPVLLLKEVVSV